MTATQELLRRRISEGILAFPATPFDATGALDPAAFEAHVDFLASHHPSALMPAGGAGELFSLSLEEHERLVKIAVAQAGNIPVIAGAGYGITTAIEMAQTAERLGAAGVLVFPPYLITPEQDGLAAYIEGVCRSVSIGVVAYSRNNGVVAPDTALRLADKCSNLIAIKDGTGDFESLVSLKQRGGDRLALINGVPTAEMVALQCFAIGMRSYTSAVFTFLPEVALRYLRALREGDRTTMDRFLSQFFVPLSALRNRKRGYAVALVKAGLRAVGRPAGEVRPPLVDLDRHDERELAGLIETAVGLLDATARPGVAAPAAAMR